MISDEAYNAALNHAQALELRLQIELDQVHAHQRHIQFMREENDTLRAERDAARRRADAMAAELVRSDES